MKPQHRLRAPAYLFAATALLSVAFAKGETPPPHADLVIGSPVLSVTLDPNFPRVLKFQTGEGRSIPGAPPSSRPSIELNGQTYTAGDFEVHAEPTATAVTYDMTVPGLGLHLAWRFEVQEHELHLALSGVQEQGSFRLQTIEFPGHFLVRVPAASGTGHAYRGEYTSMPWKESYPGESSGQYVAAAAPLNFPGLRSNSTAHFMTIGDQSAEQSPKDANWASADLPGIAVTIADNIPYWKLKTQLLGGEGAATDFAMWLGRYYYRIQNEVQPLLDAHIAVLDQDRNGDGEVNWMEAALWQHDRLRAPSRKFDPLTLTYTVINDWVKPLHPPAGGYAPPIATFAQTLGIIRAVSRATGNARQYVVLVGWQFSGHDTGYPALNQVNERVGGLRGLRALIKDAGQYNATIVYHINLDDAYQRSPLFDPSVLQFNRGGRPYIWSFQFKDGPPDYRISHTKQFRSGYFQKRAQSLLDLVPVKEVIQLDTFRNTDISFGPGEDIGIVAETTYGAKILDWFYQRGIVPSIEGADDAYFGILERALHRNIDDPFHLLMMQGKIYGGGRYHAGEMGQVLGWSIDAGYAPRTQEVIGGTLEALDAGKIADDYFLGNVTQSYLTGKSLVWIGAESGGGRHIEEGQAPAAVRPKDFVARFSDGTVSRMTHDGYWTVLDHGVLTVDGTRRMLPVNDREVLVYSSEGGVSRWQLPAAWKSAKIFVTQIGAPASTPASSAPASPPPMSSPRVSLATDADAGVSLTVAARKAYRIRRRP